MARLNLNDKFTRKFNVNGTDSLLWHEGCILKVSLWLKSTILKNKYFNNFCNNYWFNYQTVPNLLKKVNNDKKQKMYKFEMPYFDHILAYTRCQQGRRQLYQPITDQHVKSKQTKISKIPVRPFSIVLTYKPPNFSAAIKANFLWGFLFTKEHSHFIIRWFISFCEYIYSLFFYSFNICTYIISNSFTTTVLFVILLIVRLICWN